MAKTEKPGVVKGQWFSDRNLCIDSVALLVIINICNHWPWQSDLKKQNLSSLHR